MKIIIAHVSTQNLTTLGLDCQAPRRNNNITKVASKNLSVIEIVIVIVILKVTSFNLYLGLPSWMIVGYFVVLKI